MRRWSGQLQITPFVQDLPGGKLNANWPVLCYFCAMTWQLIIGLTIPSIVVLLAVYLMFKQYFQHQTQIRVMDSRREKTQITLPLRLQAFERLILLCERIDLPDLLLRLRTPGTSSNALRSAMLLAIQQEYEHNLTQQLYVSEELWNILMTAKDKTMDLIAVAAVGLEPNATAEDYANQLMTIASAEQSLPSQIAKRAIKTESSLWL
jgi:hypothetical protein